jgi:hypothetical protein
MISLITTVDRHRIDWLPQFVMHYRELGVEQLLISLHLEPGIPHEEKRDLTDRVETTLRGVGIPLYSVIICQYTSEDIAAQHNEIRKGACAELDWVVWADIDEFQEYHDSLDKILSRCDALGITEIRGKFIDRVGRGGMLPSFDPSRSIWEQFPIGADVTTRIGHGFNTKVVACKAFLSIASGHHFIVGERTRVYPRETTIHHFKWDARVLERLRPRLAKEFKSSCYWWRETQRFQEHLERFGRIRLDMLQHFELGAPTARQEARPRGAHQP